MLAPWEIRLLHESFFPDFFLDFPGGTADRNPPANATVTGLVLQNTQAREPQLLTLQLLSARAPTMDASALQWERPPQWKARTPQPRVAPSLRN